MPNKRTRADHKQPTIFNMFNAHEPDARDEFEEEEALDGLPPLHNADEDDEDLFGTQDTVDATTTTTTPIRARGRPRRDAAPDPDLWSNTYPEQLISLTIAKRAGHIPPVWFNMLVDYLKVKAIKFLVARERGGRADNVHLQCVLVGKCLIDKKSIDKIKAEIKAALNIHRGDGSNMSMEFKPAGPGQTLERLCGYCMKDEGLAHHIYEVKNITREEIDRGIDEYKSLKLSFMDDKIALNKSNLFSKAHSYYTTYMGDTEATFSGTIAEMLNSDKYMLSATVLMNSQGQMRHVSAETYWQIIKGEIKATSKDVENMIYTEKPSQVWRVERDVDVADE